jgi:hypothetical protein
MNSDKKRNIALLIATAFFFVALISGTVYSVTPLREAFVNLTTEEKVEKLIDVTEIQEQKIVQVTEKAQEIETRTTKTEQEIINLFQTEDLQQQVLLLQEELAKANDPLKTPCPNSNKVPSCYVPCPNGKTSYCSPDWIKTGEYSLDRIANPRIVYDDDGGFEWSVNHFEGFTNGPSSQWRPIISEPITVVYGDYTETALTNQEGIASFNLPSLGTGQHAITYSSQFMIVEKHIVEY